jgi:type IV secretion system protein VirB6
VAAVCAADPTLGVVARLSVYLDCEGRAIGENGFAALVGSPTWGALTLSVVTIFIALIGYRMMLGRLPTIGDGVGWAVRLGVVLSFVTGTAAFQAAVYRAAVDTPGELAAAILPAAGLSGDNLGARLQDAYDRLRLGAFGNAPLAVPRPALASPEAPAALGASSGLPSSSVPGQAAAPLAPAQLSYGVFPLPQTAMLFAVTTAGMGGGLHVAAGLLLAVAPLAFFSLLSDATLGLFSGWVRALAGVSLGLVANTVSSALTLAAIDAEAAHIDAGRIARATLAEIDPGALTATVAVSAVLTLLTLIAAMRMASAFRLPLLRWLPEVGVEGGGKIEARASAPALSGPAQGARTTPASASIDAPPNRAAAVAYALDATIRREGANRTGSAASATLRAATVAEASARGRLPLASGPVPLGAGGRRTTGRRTGSAIRRDRAR